MQRGTNKIQIDFFLPHNFLSMDNDDQMWQHNDHRTYNACILVAKNVLIRLKLTYSM